MKKMKKLASLLLALVMTFAMASTVFATATDPGDTTEPTDPASRYQIYQIFTGDATGVTSEGEGTLSNVVWGQNGTGEVGESVDEETLKAIADLAGKSDSEAVDTIKNYANLETDPIAEGNETSYDLPSGYYLVKDNPEFKVPEGEANTLYVVRVVNNVLSFQPKVGAPESDKKILEDGEEKEVNDVAIGDTVKYQITGTIPERFDDYKEYYYVFKDNLSKGLTVETDDKGRLADVKVVVKNGEDEADVTEYFWANAEKEEESGVTKITIGMQNIKQLLNLSSAVTLVPGTEIIVTYSAILNEDANIGTANPNDVVLEYSRDPNQSGNGTEEPPEEPKEPKPEYPTGETPESVVRTYTTELNIKKWDATNIPKVPLAGVEFTLTGETLNIVLVSGSDYVKVEEDETGEYWKLKDGSYTTTAPTVAEDDTDNTDAYESLTAEYKKVTVLTSKTEAGEDYSVSGVVDENGTLTFTGLMAGDYTLTEKVLSGYNDLEPIEFTITFDEETEKFATNNDKISLDSDNTFSTDIDNKKGSLLPSTGGIGTTIFYVVGTILVLGAGILLVTKRRMKAQ